jgi:hypothetical protein
MNINLTHHGTEKPDKKHPDRPVTPFVNVRAWGSAQR